MNVNRRNLFAVLGCSVAAAAAPAITLAATAVATDSVPLRGDTVRNPAGVPGVTRWCAFHVAMRPGETFESRAMEQRPDGKWVMTFDRL